MFSPSELAGEVDHTFFDSDDGSREGGKNVDGKLTAKDDALSTLEKLQSKPNAFTNDQYKKDDGAKKIPRPVDNNSSRDFRREEGCKSDKVSTYGTESQKETDVYLKSSKHLMGLLADAKEVDEVAKDDYEEEVPEIQVKNLRTNKKQTKNSWRPSTVSSEAGADIDSKSSSSDLSITGSEAHSKSNKSSSSLSRDRGVRVASATSEDTYSKRTDESIDTVTDVSPLSSPDSSCLQSFDLNHSDAEDDCLKESQESVPSCGSSTARQDGNSSEEADDYSLNSESRLSVDKVAVQLPGARHRKNYSFSNDEVQRIDRENQRLLRQLSRFSTGSRTESDSGQRKCVRSNTPLNRLPHSALNRQREQQRIERENLAFLKRLESVKPTPGMKRSEQLSDYQRQVGYLGMSPVYQSTTKKSTSRESSVKGLRQSKASHYSARAASTATDLSCTPVPRAKKTTAAQS